MVDPISMSMITNSVAAPAKGLTLPINTTGGTETAVATATHTGQVVENIATHITETNKTEAAERAGLYKQKLRATSRRNQNFPQTKSRDSSEALDTDWEFRGAKSSNSQEVLRKPEQPSDAWSRIGATSERLSKIDPDFSRNGSQLYAIA